MGHQPLENPVWLDGTLRSLADLQFRSLFHAGIGWNRFVGARQGCCLQADASFHWPFGLSVRWDVRCRNDGGFSAAKSRPIWGS